MTANEMKFSFLLKFDSMFEFSAPNYDDRQISYILTNAQNRVIMDVYDPKGRDQEGFEATERKRRSLEQLIKQEAWPSGNVIKPSSIQTGVHPNGKFFDLPSDFLLAVEEAAVTSELANKEVVVKPVTHDQYLANINNPYKKPYSNLVWRMDYSRQTNAIGTSTASAKRIELISNPDLAQNSVTAYRLRYLQMPPAIVVDEFNPSNQRHCILDPILMHDAIIDEAVKIATASIKPETYQIADKERTDN